MENVTSLALTYGFVTPFTSLLVDTTVDEPEAKDDNSGSYTNDGTNDGTYSGGDNSGSEGESEAEAESESESESEAEGEGEGESESESESEKEQKPGYSNLEQMEKSPNYYPTENETIGYYEKEQFGDSKPGAENEAGSVNKSKPENDTDRESIIRIEAEPEISRYTKITISITNSNENICKIYWLGIHFDWQAEDQYCVCTDLSVEKTKTIAPGDKESCYLYNEVPGSVNLGYHSYNILFRNDLQDDWFGGWNGYYWQSETKANFNVNENNKVYDEPSTSSDDSSSNSPNPYLHPAALQPEVTVHESKTEEETKNDMALPIEPVVDNSEDGALPVMDASNERIKDTNAHEEIRETGDNTQPTENNDDTLIALFLALTIIIIIIISFIYIRKKRYRRQQLVRSELIVKYIKKHPGTDVHKILKALDHSMADIDDILDKLEGKDAIKSRPAGKKRLFYIKDTQTILKT